MILQQVDSITIFKFHWRCWKMIGIYKNYKDGLKYKYWNIMYDVLLNIGVTICYPLHLTIGLFFDTTKADIFKNLSISITCIVCSFQHYCFRSKLPKILAIESIFSELDQRALDADEQRYFCQNIKVTARRVCNMFVTVCVCANASSFLAVVLASERRLMYPAWFPFDWKTNTFYYAIALCYQFVGVTIQIIQNLINDTYVPMSLCIFAGHVHLLSMRVSKIGHDPKYTQYQNEQKIIACIEDHIRLIRIFHMLEDTYSLALMAQFIFSGLTICVVLVHLLFYVDSIFGYIYYTVYLFAMILEIFPVCYYGSVLELELEKLSLAVYSSNWLFQSRKFQKNVIIFTELALRKFTPLAGGIILIRLTTFFATCKMAYSLFAVIMQVK